MAQNENRSTDDEIAAGPIEEKDNQQ